MKTILFGISLMVFAIWTAVVNAGGFISGIGAICALVGLLISVAAFFSSFEKK